MSRLQKISLGLIGLAVVGLVVIQILPVGRFFPVLNRVPNPPVTQTIVWDSPQTEQLARAACYDCHSNETVWPWYAQLAPTSWLLTRDVNKGRAAMNFSEDAAPDIDVDDIEWHLFNDMPPWFYLPLHPAANLNPDQKNQLLAGLSATFGSDGQMEMGSS
ncbi:MAG TPA: heme-binding domain-containing protein [Phototrophicaceae bacterium]|nr:heme-binding domain-containing protein [Phototrophicaceae bacterium]